MGKMLVALCCCVWTRSVSSDFWVPLKLCMSLQGAALLLKACPAVKWSPVNVNPSSVVNHVLLWVKSWSGSVFWVCSGFHFLWWTAWLTLGRKEELKERGGEKAAKELLFFSLVYGNFSSMFRQHGLIFSIKMKSSGKYWPQMGGWG